MTAEVNNSDLYALHSKISDHVKNKTPLYLIDPEIDLLDSVLTVRYNLIDIFNRLRCSVPEMPGEGATDDEQKEIDKIRHPRRVQVYTRDKETVAADRETGRCLP